MDSRLVRHALQQNAVFGDCLFQIALLFEVFCVELYDQRRIGRRIDELLRIALAEIGEYVDRQGQYLRIARVGFLQPGQKAHRIRLPVQQHRAAYPGEACGTLRLQCERGVTHSRVEERHRLGATPVHGQLYTAIVILQNCFFPNLQQQPPHRAHGRQFHLGIRLLHLVERAFLLGNPLLGGGLAGFDILQRLQPDRSHGGKIPRQSR